jgi:hypothetical protein
MIRIPEIDGLTQARHPGEIDDMARSYIAVKHRPKHRNNRRSHRIAGVKHAAA